MLLSCNSQGVGFLFMAWLVSIIDINNTLAQTDSKLDAMTPSKTTLICDPLHQEFTNVFCEIYCWCDITHPQCKGYESECICTNEIYLSHTVLIIYLILFNHYYTKGRVTKKWTHIFFTKLDDILLLETPCSLVRPLVRHVFYPHLTRMHTNLICERAR